MDEPCEFDSAASLLEIVLRAQRQTLVETADEVTEFDGVLALRSPSIPHVWVTSQLRVRRSIDLVELVDLAERYQSACDFRHVVLEHTESARRLAGPLLERGWSCVREIQMVFDPGAVPQAPGHPVVDLSLGEATGLLRRWRAEDLPGLSSSVLDELDEYHRREAAPWAERALGIRDASGRPVAVTMSRERSQVGWIEDVYTIPEARRRGYTRALVTRAVELARAARCAPIFIVADADDFPRQLYAAAGFRPIGLVHTFHLDLTR